MSHRECFLWGCFGSVLPEILRLYNIVTHEQALPRFVWPYFIISLVFVLAAGAFTIAWEPENRFKAIWVGASFPTLVSTLIKSVPPLPTPPTAPGVGFAVSSLWLTLTHQFFQ